MDKQTIKLLVAEVNSLGQLLSSDADESTRKKLILAAEKLIIAARTPGENLYLTTAQPFLNGSIGAAYTMGIFDCVPEDPHVDIGAAQISLKTGAEKALVDWRREICIQPFLKDSQYTSKPGAFSVPNLVLGPAAGSLGEYLQTHSLKNPTDHRDAPLQFSLKTSLDLWSYLKEEPSKAKMFNESMRSSAIVGAAAVPNFPFVEKLKCKSEDEVVIVDVGGGKGQALESIRKAFPELSGRMIVQDLPEVIADTKASGHLPPAIKTMSADFFKPQPIQGAKAYLLRRIMHDWSDEACSSILKNIIPSMSVDSRILINELVLPDEGCEKRMALNDLVMLTFGGMERSESQWIALLQEVGLEIKRIWRKEGENLSLIESMLKN